MSDGHQKLPPKKEVALALLEGPSMFVHLDPRRSGVSVPKRFLDKPQLVLQIGLNMFIPIPDLKVDDEGITCTLSFDRAPFWVRMPWNAIYALVGEDGRGMMWPTDIPKEVVAQMQAPPQQQQPQKDAGKPAQKRPRAKLSAVGDAPPEPEQKPEPEDVIPIRPVTEDEARNAVMAESVASEDAEETKIVDEPTLPSGAPEPSRQQPSPVGGRKPRRELPPYLRVIK